MAVTVSDDDAAPTGITLSVDPSSVVEDVSSAPTVTVTAAVNGTTRYAAAKMVAVEVGDADDSATEGTDYQAVGELKITIAAGAASGEATFTLTPTDDAIAEGDEEVSVSGSSDVPVSPVKLTLSDDDLGLLALAIDEATVTEAADAAFALNVTLRNGDGEDLTLADELEVKVTPSFEAGVGKAGRRGPDREQREDADDGGGSVERDGLVRGRGGRRRRVGGEGDVQAHRGQPPWRSEPGDRRGSGHDRRPA